MRVGAQFSAAFDRAPVGLALLDHDWLIVRANAALSRLTGYGLDDLVGRVCSDLMADPSDPPRDPTGDSSAGGTGSGLQSRQEVRRLTAGGQERWVCRSLPRRAGGHPRGAEKNLRARGAHS